MDHKKFLPLPAGRIAGVTALLVVMTLPLVAEAGERTRQTARQRTDHGHVRHDSWTNATGRTATRDATVVNDRATRTRTRDVLWTGPDGQQATRQDVTRRTADGYTRDSVFTGPGGQQATRNAVVVNDREAGTRSRSVVATGAEGRQRTVEDQLERTGTGYARSTVVTNPNGAINTRTVDASYDPETRTWSKEVTRDRTPPATDGE